MSDFTLNGRNYTVIESGDSITESELLELERKIGITLPPQLRDFYLKWNGGTPLPDDIDISKSAWVHLHWNDKKSAESFESATGFEGMPKINSHPATDFFRTWNDFKHRIPNDLIMFARDPGGSLFLIGIKKHNLGRIYFWERSYEADIEAGESPSYDNIAYIADSFSEFLLLLREEPDEDEEIDDWLKRVYR